MKHTIKLMGIIALVALIGFMMASCGGGGDGGSGGTGGSGGLSGTYIHESGMGDLQFSGRNWTVRVFGIVAERGTFVVTGDIATLTVTYTVPEMSNGEPAKVGDRRLITILDSNTLRDDEGDYWRK